MNPDNSQKEKEVGASLCLVLNRSSVKSLPTEHLLQRPTALKVEPAMSAWLCGSSVHLISFVYTVNVKLPSWK